MARPTSHRAAASTCPGRPTRSQQHDGCCPITEQRDGARVPGVRLGIDPGDARIGVAACDPGGILATPVETVPRGEGDLQRIAVLAEGAGASLVYVGLPRSLSGREGPSAAKVRGFAQQLADALAPLPVRLVDERLSTVTAEAVLRSRGRKGARRRAVVDQAAAVVILQGAIDTERVAGAAVGELLAPTDREEEA